MFASVWNWCLARVSLNLNCCSHRSMEEEAVVPADIVLAAFLPHELKKHCSMASIAFLPTELIVEIISRLPMKYLLQLRCISKFYKTLISNPYFVQMHLEKSARNPCLALMWQDDLMHEDCRIITLSVSSS